MGIQTLLHWVDWFQVSSRKEVLVGAQQASSSAAGPPLWSHRVLKGPVHVCCRY